MSLSTTVIVENFAGSGTQAHLLECYRRSLLGEASLCSQQELLDTSLCKGHTIGTTCNMSAIEMVQLNRILVTMFYLCWPSLQWISFSIRSNKTEHIPLGSTCNLSLLFTVVWLKGSTSKDSLVLI